MRGVTRAANKEQNKMRVTNWRFFILLQQGPKGEIGISGEQGIPGPPVCCAFNSLVFLAKLPF